MLFRCHAGKGLKPMGIMGCPSLNGPILHGMSHHICNRRIQLCPILNRLFHLLKYTLGQTLLHHRLIKYIFSKYFRNLYNLAHRHSFPLLKILVPIFQNPYHPKHLSCGACPSAKQQKRHPPLSIRKNAFVLY